MATMRVVASLCLAVVVVACSGDGDVATPDAGPRCPPEEDTSGPAVSFTSDLMLLFRGSCAFSGCHDELTKSAGLFLGAGVIGPDATVMTPAEVYASVMAPATTTPDLPRVTPGHPERSFLFLKVEGCQNGMGLTCRGAIANAPCGDRMPALSDELSVEKRRVLARWIQQGAPGPK